MFGNSKITNDILSYAEVKAILLQMCIDFKLIGNTKTDNIYICSVISNKIVILGFCWSWQVNSCLLFSLFWENSIINNAMRSHFIQISVKMQLSLPSKYWYLVNYVHSKIYRVAYKTRLLCLAPSSTTYLQNYIIPGCWILYTFQMIRRGHTEQESAYLFILICRPTITRYYCLFSSVLRYQKSVLKLHNCANQNLHHLNVFITKPPCLLIQKYATIFYHKRWWRRYYFIYLLPSNW